MRKTPWSNDCFNIKRKKLKTVRIVFHVKSVPVLNSTKDKSSKLHRKINFIEMNENEMEIKY